MSTRTTTRGSAPRLLYFAYDHQRPSGGQKTTYRHVDILVRNGFDAAVFHQADGFRLDWFSNATPVVGPADLRSGSFGGRVIFVLPEDLGRMITRFPGRKVVFDQGPSLGFSALGLARPRLYPYLDDSVGALIVVSEASRAHLKYAFPDRRIIRVTNAVSGERFRFVPLRRKHKIVAMAANKNRLDVMQVFHLLRSRATQRLNNAIDWKFVSLENLNEQALRNTLARASFLLFLSMHEGFGILPIEAMLSGTIVLAYSTPPMTEYLTSGNSLLSRPGDFLSVARDVERAIEWSVAEPARLEAIAARARAGAERFSLERQEASVLRAWREILRSPRWPLLPRRK